MASLHHHNDDEEIDDLPALEAVISQDATKEAALSFKRTKKFVPTRYVPAVNCVGLRNCWLIPPSFMCRAHPSAPNQPPLETFVGFLAAPIDKLKDAFASFPTEDEKEAAEEELEHRDHDAKAGRNAAN